MLPRWRPPIGGLVDQLLGILLLFNLKWWATLESISV
jgi:hypothetical protein